jgi:IS5 family transposase
VLLQAFCGIRSERQLMERLEFDLLFRWFVGLGIDDAVWDHSTFSKNRDRLLEGEITRLSIASASILGVHNRAFLRTHSHAHFSRVNKFRLSPRDRRRPAN